MMSWPATFAPGTLAPCRVLSISVLIQWVGQPDWITIDAYDWPSLPADRMAAVNIQGVTFNSFVEYAVEVVSPDEVNLYCWHDPRPDYPGGEMTGWHGHKWTFRTLAPDPLFGGAYNTNQTKETFYEPGDRVYGYPAAGIETKRQWSEFVMPASLIKLGVLTVSASEMEANELAHIATRRVVGWRHWTRGLPAGETEADGTLKIQRDLGRWKEAEGTITYFQRDTDRATGIHAADNEDALELTTASLVSENATVPMGGSVFAWVFTTPENEPNVGDWPNGLYRCQLDVQTSSNPFDYGFLTLDGKAGHFARVNSGLTSDEETWTQTQGAFSGTGLRLASRTINPDSGAASDRFECNLVWFDTCGCGGTVTLDLNISDAFVDGPWVAPAAGAVAMQPKKVNELIGV